MEIFTVAFFGHRYVDDMNRVERRLSELVRDLLGRKENVEFLVGRNGEFDQLVSSSVRIAKREMRDDNSSLTLVLSYPTAEYVKNQESFEAYSKSAIFSVYPRIFENTINVRQSLIKSPERPTSAIRPRPLFSSYTASSKIGELSIPDSHFASKRLSLA